MSFLAGNDSQNCVVYSQKVDNLYPRKVMEVAERCKRKGWNCPHMENNNSCIHMEEIDYEPGEL